MKEVDKVDKEIARSYQILNKVVIALGREELVNKPIKRLSITINEKDIPILEVEMYCETECETGDL